jgi:hypothetical protein
MDKFARSPSLWASATICTGEQISTRFILQAAIQGTWQPYVPEHWLPGGDHLQGVHDLCDAAT